MTEEEWRACDDPERMLDWLRKKASDRKLRLFACACCRRIWHLPDGEDVSRQAVEVAERFADGLTGEAELRAAHTAAWDAWYPDEATPREQMEFTATAAFAGTTGYTSQHTLTGGSVIERTTWDSIRESVAGVLWVEAREEEEGRFERERHLRARREASDLARCVFGNPYRAVTADRGWVTSTVRALAVGAYEAREFECLPILGDALEEAGCTDEAVLAHCRGPGPHARGCWVVDLVLGRS